MTVLVTNCVMGLRRVSTTRGAFGDRVAGAADEASPLLPANRHENGDGTWRINVDPSLWPVRVGDRLVDGDGAEWVVRSSERFTHPEVPEIDHVRTTALQDTGGGVEPGGAEFVGR